MPPTDEETEVRIFHDLSAFSGVELREDGGAELREDLSLELREG